MSGAGIERGLSHDWEVPESMPKGITPPTAGDGHPGPAPPADRGGQAGAEKAEPGRLRGADEESRFEAGQEGGPGRIRLAAEEPAPAADRRGRGSAAAAAPADR